MVHNVSSSLPTSCQEVTEENPNCPSDFYLLVPTIPVHIMLSVIWRSFAVREEDGQD